MRVYVVMEPGDTKLYLREVYQLLEERIVPRPQVVLATTNNELVKELLNQAEFHTQPGRT